MSTASRSPVPLEGRDDSLSEEELLESRVFIKFYSKLIIVFRDKDYLPHLVTTRIISPDNVHHLSGLLPRDRAMRVLEYVSDSLDGGDKECFNSMLEIMRNHGNSYAQNLAEKITKTIDSGVDCVASLSRAKSGSMGSVASFRSDRSARSDSMGSTSTGAVSPVSTSAVNSINFDEYDDISVAFSLLTAEVAKLLKRADFRALRRALLQQRKTPRGVQFPDDLHQSIKEAQDLDALLDVLVESDYWSWVEIRLLEALIASSGINEANRLIQKYKEAIFPKKLSEVLDKLPLPPQKEYKEAYATKVGSKIQKEPEDVTVKDLSLYCTKLEKVIMDINSGSCVLEHLDKGCLEIYWLIPAHCRFHAYKSALSNRHKFSDIQLQYLHIEPYPPIYNPFTIKPTMLSTLLRLPKPIASTPVEVISHYYCFLLESLDNSAICQIMLEMKLLTEDDLVHSALLYSDYQKNAFLIDHLLVTGTVSILKFCTLLQNTENQHEIGNMLVNGIESIPVSRADVARAKALSQSFSFEEDDTDSISISCTPEVFLTAKTVHIRFLNLVSQLKRKLKDYDPQSFLEACQRLTTGTHHLKTVSLIPSEYLEDVDDADDTGTIFGRLAFLWTWISHSILRALLEACSCQDGIRMLDDFESQIDANQPMELFPIPPPSAKMAPSLSSAYTVLVIRRKHDLDEPVPLQYVNDVANILVEKFGISLHALQLLAGQATNPLVLYWVILKITVPLIHSKVVEHVSFLKESKFTEIVVYPSTVLFATDNLNLGPYATLRSQPQLEVDEQNAGLKAEVSELKSSNKYLSNELRKLKDKYHSSSQEFGKSIFIDEAEGIMDQLEEILTEVKSNFKTLPCLKKLEDKESAVTMKFPPLDYSEMVSDVSTRPSTFISRMRDFKGELEETKDWHQYIESLEADLSAKDLEVDWLKSAVDNLQTQNDRIEQLNSRLITLQSDYDVKVKEMDDMQSEHEAVAEQYRQLMEQNIIDGKDSDTFSQYSVPDSLEYDAKEKKTVLHYGAIMGHVPLVQILIRFGEDVNVVDKEKRTALHYGAFNGHVSIVEILVTAGADVNAVDEEKRSALHFGAENGHVSVVEVLIKLGAHVNVEDEWTPLHAAVKGGHVMIAEILLKSGADVGTDINKWTPLHVAARNGHLAMVEILIKSGAALGIDMVGKWTPLHAAARFGHAAVVEALIKAGANAGAAVINKWAPLHIAVKHGHTSVIESLISLGADVNARSTDNWTPLLSAARNGRTKVVEALIRSGADVHTGDMDKWTPLHAAARQGHVSVVEILIKSGADVCATDLDKCTPIHSAAEKGHDEVVKLLLNFKADVNAVTANQQSPLHLAAEYGHADVVETLTQSGAITEAVTRDKCTPLHLAAQNAHVQVIDTLIRLGADINATTVEKQSPLHIAAGKGHVSVVETLIELKADLNMVDNRNWTPLHLAVQKHHISVIEILIRSGANVNAVDKSESSSLHFAVENNHVDTVELLIKSNADINARNRAGLAPLHIAAQNGYIQVLKMLIDCGAKLDVVNKNLYTPLHLAAKSGHIEVIETLVKAGADINAVNIKNKSTPIHMAVREDNALVVEKLVNLGADINALTFGNRTPLQEAVHLEKKSVIYYFVEELEVDITQLDEYTQKWIEGWQRDLELQKRPIHGYDYESDHSAISSGHESDTSHEE